MAEHTVRRAFSLAAKTYSDAAALQREVNERLFERLDLLKIAPEAVLDAGAGIGFGYRSLLKRYKKAHIVALDFALPMLRELRGQSQFWRRPSCVCADIAALPFADNSFDLLYSSLALQWCEDLSPVFSEALRVLKPGGALLFSSLGPDTLYELRQSWAAVDQMPHVNVFLDMHLVGDAMLQAGLQDPVVDVERLVLTYKAPLDLLRELKHLGAQSVPGRANRLTGKRRLGAMQEAYAAHRTEQGLYPATYEVIYGLAWKPNGKPTGQSDMAMSEQPLHFKPHIPNKN